MVELNIQAITKEYGCCVYTTLILPEDYTMNMVVNEVNDRGYKAFRIVDTMNCFVYI